MGQRIDWLDSGVICTYTEYVSLRDIMRVLAEVNTDARLTTESYLIHDFTRALHIDSGAAALISIAGHTLGGGNEILTVKTAVITPDAAFASRLNSFEKQAVRQVRGFASMAHAKLWLGIS